MLVEQRVTVNNVMELVKDVSPAREQVSTVSYAEPQVSVCCVMVLKNVICAVVPERKSAVINVIMANVAVVREQASNILLIITHG